MALLSEKRGRGTVIFNMVDVTPYVVVRGAYAYININDSNISSGGRDVLLAFSDLKLL